MGFPFPYADMFRGRIETRLEEALVRDAVIGECLLQFELPPAPRWISIQCKPSHHQVCGCVDSGRMATAV